MKKHEIVRGGKYVAKVGGKLTVVTVNEIRERSTYNDKVSTVYDVTNNATGRKTTFRSAAKFRAPAKSSVTPEMTADFNDAGH